MRVRCPHRPPSTHVSRGVDRLLGGGGGASGGGGSLPALRAQGPPRKSAAGGEKFPAKQPFSMDFALESAETDKLGQTDCRTATRCSCRPPGCLLLLLLPRLLLPVCQQPCSRASGLDDGPAATRTNVQDALAILQDVRRRCSACCSACPARQRRPAPRSGALC